MQRQPRKTAYYLQNSQQGDIVTHRKHDLDIAFARLIIDQVDNNHPGRGDFSLWTVSRGNKPQGRLMKSSLVLWINLAFGSAFLVTSVLGVSYYGSASGLVERISLVSCPVLLIACWGLARFAMHRENTCRQQTEGMQRASETKLLAIVDSAMDAIVTIDHEQRIVLFNAASERMFRCPASEAIGQPVERFIPERFRPQHREHVRDFGQTSVTQRRIVVTGLRADGEELPIQASISQSDLAGQKLYSVILRDVTESKRSEERIREQAALLDKTRDAIVLCDLEDRILYWNQGAERIYGWTAAEAVGKNCKELLFHGQPLENLEEAVRSVLEKGEWHGELSQSTKDGKTIIVESRWTLSSDEQGRPYHVLVINTDVTEKKKTEVHFLRAQRLQSIGVLAGGIAHDLNNVLTPILMTVKLLKKDRPEAERQGLLETAQASVERGAEMVRQLVAFAGGVEGQQAAVQLKHVISEVKSLLNHTLPKPVSIQVEMADDLWTVSGDATQFSQVLMNLCVNARDAMPSGGTLTIAAENTILNGNYAQTHPEAKPGPHVCITVTDTGAGMPAEVLDRIFDPFFTTKELGKGTGLGLSTALGIVKGFGGSVNVYSEVGKGTRFTIYLPALQTEETERAEAKRPDLAVGRGELILVVDDEAFILVTANATLEEYGYRVLTAANGREALECYQQHREEIQVVVLDMMMPGIDGPTTMRALRELDPRVRIIASSGLRASGRTAEAVAAGAKVFLQKPYTDEHLLQALARALGDR